jgi:hypothetical protein
VLRYILPKEMRLLTFKESSPWVDIIAFKLSTSVTWARTTIAEKARKKKIKFGTRVIKFLWCFPIYES